MAWNISVDDFWEIVERGSRSDESQHEAAHRITDRLVELDEDSVLQWGLIYERYHELADQGKLWGAANIMDDGFCSDDGFHYFRGWLIAQGRDTYHMALQDPDSLASLPEQDEVRFELVNYAAVHAYESFSDDNDDYYTILRDMSLPSAIEDEILSGIVFAPDIGDTDYINGNYPEVFPNLTKLYDHGDPDVDIGVGDTARVLSHMKKLNKFRYEDIDDGKTGMASLSLAHDIVEAIRDHGAVRLGGMYARVAFMLELAGKIEAGETGSATALVEPMLAGQDGAARLVGRIRAYDDELQAQFIVERDGGMHPDNRSVIAERLPEYSPGLRSDPAFIDMAEKRALHDNIFYALSSAVRKYSRKYSLDNMKDQRKTDPVGYTYAMLLAYTKVCCLNSKNMRHVYDRHMEARADQIEGRRTIAAAQKMTPEEKPSITELLARGKKAAAQEQAAQQKDTKKSGPEL